MQDSSLPTCHSSAFAGGITSPAPSACRREWTTAWCTSSACEPGVPCMAWITPLVMLAYEPDGAVAWYLRAQRTGFARCGSSRFACCCPPTCRSYCASHQARRRSVDNSAGTFCTAFHVCRHIACCYLPQRSAHVHVCMPCHARHAMAAPCKPENRPTGRFRSLLSLHMLHMTGAAGAGGARRGRSRHAHPGCAAAGIPNRARWAWANPMLKAKMGASVQVDAVPLMPSTASACHHGMAA